MYRQNTPSNGEKYSHLPHHLKYSYVFYPKWVHSPAEPAHNLQNQEIMWFLHYNVIHSPTSTFSNCSIVWIYLFFLLHPFFFFRVLLRFSVIWIHLMDLKHTWWIWDLGGLFYMYFFSLKMVLMFIHVVTCMNTALFFPS